MDLKTTPLIDEHRRLGAKCAPFGGYLMPIQYTGILAEHMWTRQNVSLFDICHMGEFLIRGDGDACGLNRIVSFDVTKVPVGSCRYGFMLNDAGGIMDDLIVYRIGREEWMVVVNAATIESDEVNFHKHLAPSADFKNISPQTAKLDLQGPRSLEVLKKFAGADVAALRYYTFDQFELLGESVLISRTGYTGELGYEIYLSADTVVRLWTVLLADELVKPAGLGARDTLRLEMCYPLYGQDLSAEITPFEADLRQFVDPVKDFIGKAALRKNADPARKLICFMADSRRSPRHHYRIMKGAEDVGVVTSGSFSPSLSCGIGMGYVSVPCPVGTPIVLKDEATEISATVVKKPFYKKGTARQSEVGHAHTG